MFYARIIETPETGIMVSLVDEELLGIKVVDESSGIIIDVSESFYRGNKVDEKEAIELIKKADVVIMTGERIISLAIDLGFVNPTSVLKVKGISHVQLFKFNY